MCVCVCVCKYVCACGWVGEDVFEKVKSVGAGVGVYVGKGEADPCCRYPTPRPASACTPESWPRQPAHEYGIVIEMCVGVGV